MNQYILCNVNKRLLMNERGSGTAKNFFWVIFTLACFYVAYIFVPPYVNYRIFKAYVEDEARQGRIYKEDTLKKRMIDLAYEWNIPVEDSDIHVIRSGAAFDVSIFYVVTIDALGWYKKDVEHFIEVSVPALE